MVRIIVAFCLVGVWLAPASSVAVDPYDPFDFDVSPKEDPFGSDDDASKSSEELIMEATFLLQDQRPLDARTKLLKALKKDPNNHNIHILLGHYYNSHVGHFRLALKYIKRSAQLFREQAGSPPYGDPRNINDHSRILHLLSDVRLNLDNYQGALDALDAYGQHYYGKWYPGSRAWILMKLGRLKEAVQTARQGVLADADPGRTYNILAILLSLIGQREESLGVFNKAIIYEMSLGSLGQPATPLNNSGEVYREIFSEDRAEASWRKALSMPDGCEHVLPSLNLTLMYIEQLKFAAAKKTIDNFEACVTQYVLRNGEEHRALVHLARGRIALHTGSVDSSIDHLQKALERKQWFGKIGTDLEDLQAGTMISMGQALLRQNNQIRFKRDLSWSEWLLAKKDMAFNKLRAWWMFRRARQILSEDLENLEDLYIRHTDSLVEYHTLGEALKGFPTRLLQKRIQALLERDNRPQARPYYNAYLAESYLNRWGRRQEGLRLLEQSLKAARPGPDDALITHLTLRKLALLDSRSQEYLRLISSTYRQAPGEIRNHGLRLPVKGVGLSSEIQSELNKGAFIVDQGSAQSPFAIAATMPEGILTLTFSSSDTNIHFEAQGKRLRDVIDQLTDLVFTQNLT